MSKPQIGLPALVSKLSKPTQAIQESFRVEDFHLSHMLVGLYDELNEYQLADTDANILEELADNSFYGQGIFQAFGVISPVEGKSLLQAVWDLAPGADPLWAHFGSEYFFTDIEHPTSIVLVFDPLEEIPLSLEEANRAFLEAHQILGEAIKRILYYRKHESKKMQDVETVSDQLCKGLLDWLRSILYVIKTHNLDPDKVQCYLEQKLGTRYDGKYLDESANAREDKIGENA